MILWLVQFDVYSLPASRVILVDFTWYVFYIDFVLLQDEMDQRIRELTIELNNDNVFYIVNVNVQQLEDKV